MIKIVMMNNSKLRIYKICIYLQNNLKLINKLEKIKKIGKKEIKSICPKKNNNRVNKYFKKIKTYFNKHLKLNLYLIKAGNLGNKMNNQQILSTPAPNPN